jgi:predicted aspartyl protease
MGTFSIPIQVADETGSRYDLFDALVDTGASYTWIPQPALEALGHRPEHERDFELADGRLTTYGVKSIVVRVNGNETPTWVVFGDPGTSPLLGAVTLRELGLGVDALNERLVPVPGLLKGFRGVR